MKKIVQIILCMGMVVILSLLLNALFETQERLIPIWSGIGLVILHLLGFSSLGFYLCLYYDKVREVPYDRHVYAFLLVWIMIYLVGICLGNAVVGGVMSMNSATEPLWSNAGMAVSYWTAFVG